MTDFPRLGHIALTVLSCDESRPWYSALFGADPVLEGRGDGGRHVVWALPGGTFFGIREHAGKKPERDRFDELRVGLDHASFHCQSRAELDDWAQRLDLLGYPHGDVVEETYGSGLTFRDPDGNALELFALPGT